MPMEPVTYLQECEHVARLETLELHQDSFNSGFR